MKELISLNPDEDDGGEEEFIKKWDLQELPESHSDRQLRQGAYYKTNATLPSR